MNTETVSPLQKIRAWKNTECPLCEFNLTCDKYTRTIILCLEEEADPFFTETWMFQRIIRKVLNRFSYIKKYPCNPKPIEVREYLATLLCTNKEEFSKCKR